MSCGNLNQHCSSSLASPPQEPLTCTPYFPLKRLKTIQECQYFSPSKITELVGFRGYESQQDYSMEATHTHTPDLDGCLSIWLWWQI